MPRKYQRKTNIGNWTADQLLQAISAVKRGIAIREAGREYGIPEATIRKRMKLGDAEESTKGPNMGKSPIFSEQQEKELSEHVLNLAKMFYGMTSIQFRKLAFAYAEANNIKHSFNINRKMAGKDWYYQFLKRHPEISLRKPEIKKNRRRRAVEERLKNKVKSKASLTKKRYRLKKILNSDSSSEEEVDVNQLCDDDELDDLPSEDNEKCVICDDFSRKNELWYRCTQCSRWAHALCSGWDTPENYVCDFCDH